MPLPMLSPRAGLVLMDAFDTLPAGTNRPSRACSGVNNTDSTGVRVKQFEKLIIPMMNFLVKRFPQAGLLCGNGAAKTAAAGFWPIA